MGRAWETTSEVVTGACVCVCVSVCVRETGFCVCVWVCFSVCVYVFVSFSLWVCLYVRVFVSMSAFLSPHVLECPCLCIFVCVYVSLFYACVWTQIYFCNCQALPEAEILKGNRARLETHNGQRVTTVPSTPLKLHTLFKKVGGGIAEAGEAFYKQAI